MMTLWQWMLGHRILAFAAACMLLLVAGYLYERNAERRDRMASDAPGQMVQVGNYRLHLNCKGSVGPTVVIEQGAGEPARLWWPMQDRVAQFARVCTYDRAGYGWSDSVADGRSIDERVVDLHMLLTNARLPGPFVFVAHSYGGLIVRRFAALYPDLAAALVLVDTPEEAVLFRPEVLKFYSRMGMMLKVFRCAARFGVLRLLAKRYPIEAVGLPFVRPGEYSTALDDLASLDQVEPAMRLSRGFGTLGSRPLAVITHGLAFPGPFAVLDQGWSDGQARLAALSSAGELIVAKNSNHMIQQDEPDLVVDVIRRIHEAVLLPARPIRSAQIEVPRGVSVEGAKISTKISN
jgi:pimeloyl-ACP methyl ester carboxylesterase